MVAGVCALRAFDRESYHGPAEANQPTASQIAAHSPSDRNNTAVIDTRSDQSSGVRFPINGTAGLGLGRGTRAEGGEIAVK